jgi:hypothetical protein
MRFGVLEKGHGANHDGIMADIVRQRRWKVSHVAAQDTFQSLELLGWKLIRKIGCAHTGQCGRDGSRSARLMCMSLQLTTELAVLQYGLLQVQS